MSQVADSYAQALYDICTAKKTTDTVLSTLSSLGQCLSDHNDIESAFHSPLISNNDKLAMLKTAVGSDCPEDLTSFLSLLAKNNRLSLVPSIVTAFESIARKDSGIVSGTVKSAVELTDSEKSELQALIEKTLSKKVTLSYSVEQGMIGGVEARVGSYIFEDSIKSHIQKLNEFITRRVQ